jgi:hemerythrin
MFRRLRRWWHLRNPEVRWIVEVGVEEVPEEKFPRPEPLPGDLSFISRYIEEDSYLLEDPHTVLSLLRSTKPGSQTRFSYRLVGSKGSLKLLVEKPQIVNKPALLLLEGEDFLSWILSYYGVITAIRFDDKLGNSFYGLKALKELSMREGEAQITVSELKDTLYKWGPEFSVYIKGIDRQHNYLVTTLNNLYRHLLAGSDREYMDETLKAMADYTKFHFRSEEVLFDKYGYPRAEAHRRQHQSFVNKVTEFLDAYNRNEERLTIQVLNFLADWVYNHILISDHDYGEWFLKKNLPFMDEEKARKAREARRKLGLDKEIPVEE